jgi:hypothetical protein
MRALMAFVSLFLLGGSLVETASIPYSGKAKVRVILSTKPIETIAKYNSERNL